MIKVFAWIQLNAEEKQLSNDRIIYTWSLYEEYFHLNFFKSQTFLSHIQVPSTTNT